MLTSMIDFMMRPAAFTIARDGCWNSLNMTFPIPAINSRTRSNLSPSVVSLYVGMGNGNGTALEWNRNRQQGRPIFTCKEGRLQMWRSPALRWSPEHLCPVAIVTRATYLMSDMYDRPITWHITCRIYQISYIITWHITWCTYHMLFKWCHDKFQEVCWWKERSFVHLFLSDIKVIVHWLHESTKEVHTRVTNSIVFSP